MCDKYDNWPYIFQIVPLLSLPNRSAHHCQSACVRDGSRRGRRPVNSLVSQKGTDFKNNISIPVIPASYTKVMFLKIPAGVQLQLRNYRCRKMRLEVTVKNESVKALLLFTH